MKRLSFIAIVLTVVAFTAGNAASEELKFHSTKNEIIQTLTQKPTRYRSFKPRQQRSFVVVEKKNAQIEETEIYKDEIDDSTVRLNITFDYDSSNLKKESFPLLNELGQALTDKQLESSIIAVNGHTDSEGPEQYNLMLSLERATSVKEYLNREFQISNERFRVFGYGESYPLKPNTLAHNKQMNRRVEINIFLSEAEASHE